MADGSRTGGAALQAPIHNGIGSIERLLVSYLSWRMRALSIRARPELVSLAGLGGAAARSVVVCITGEITPHACDRCLSPGEEVKCCPGGAPPKLTSTDERLASTFSTARGVQSGAPATGHPAQLIGGITARYAVFI